MKVYTEPEMDEIRRYHTVEKYLGALVGMGYLLHGSIYRFNIIKPHQKKHTRSPEIELTRPFFQVIRSSRGVFATIIPLVALWHATIDEHLSFLLDYQYCCKFRDCVRPHPWGYEKVGEDWRFMITRAASFARRDGYVYVVSRRGKTGCRFGPIFCGASEYYTPLPVIPEAVLPVRATDFPENKILLCEDIF